MEISITFKNPKDLATVVNTTVSISMQDIPYHAIHRIARKLPEVVSGAFADFSSQIPLNIDREFVRNFNYREGLKSGD